MISPIIIKQVKEEKKQGVSNSALMKEYKLRYAELRRILDDIKGENND